MRSDTLYTPYGYVHVYMYLFVVLFIHDAYGRYRVGREIVDERGPSGLSCAELTLLVRNAFHTCMHMTDMADWGARRIGRVHHRSFWASHLCFFFVPSQPDTGFLEFSMHGRRSSSCMRAVPFAAILCGVSRSARPVASRHMQQTC